ncbi:hypothetical protein ABWH98_16705 [Labrenzia sp. ac12]
MPLKDEIESFFTNYLRAFDNKDAEAISRLWDPVGLFPSPAGNFAMERDAFRDHCRELLDFYQKQGVVKPTGELRSVSELFPNVAQARLVYRMLGENEKTIVQWEHVYILRKTDQWRVSLTIADDEMAAWKAYGAKF